MFAMRVLGAAYRGDDIRDGGDVDGDGGCIGDIHVFMMAVGRAKIGSKQDCL